MASLHSGATPDSIAMNLQRIEIAIYGIHSMMSMLLMAGCTTQLPIVQHVDRSVQGTELGSCVPDLSNSVQSTKVSSASQLRRMRAKATRNRLWSATQHRSSSATAESSTNTQQLGSCVEELVLVSRVKQILEASSESMHENYENSSRTLMKEVQRHYEAKLDQASEELKCKQASITALQLALDEMQVDPEQRTYWKDDDASSDFAADEMDVPLRAPGASMPANSASQDGVTRRNDLGLPTTVDGAIDWERAMPLEIYEEFRRQQDSGKYHCSKCSTDVSSMQGSAV